MLTLSLFPRKEKSSWVYLTETTGRGLLTLKLMPLDSGHVAGLVGARLSQDDLDLSFALWFGGEAR
jgi:hypothetical protein